jgi:hypothetical protein
MHDFHGTFSDLLHAANLRHGNHGFTSLPKESVLRIFFAPKNPTASAGFEPANLGTKGQHATPRPPKPLYCDTFHKKCRHVTRVLADFILRKSSSDIKQNCTYTIAIYWSGMVILKQSIVYKTTYFANKTTKQNQQWRYYKYKQLRQFDEY